MACQGRPIQRLMSPGDCACSGPLADSAVAWSAPELPIVGDREAWAAAPLALEPL